MTTRLNEVINEVKEIRRENPSWIIDEKTGEIRKDVFCGEVLEVLEELKGYEINVNDDFINRFFDNDYESFNTYNYNANISNDINGHYIKTMDGEIIMLLRVHLFGDIRANYSEYFAAKFDSLDEFYSLESFYQSKDINENYYAFINLLSEEYEIVDKGNGDIIGYHYDIEMDSLMDEFDIA